MATDSWDRAKNGYGEVMAPLQRCEATRMVQGGEQYQTPFGALTGRNGQMLEQLRLLCVT